MTDIPLADFSDLPLDKYIYAKLPYQMSRGVTGANARFAVIEITSNMTFERWNRYVTIYPILKRHMTGICFNSLMTRFTRISCQSFRI